MKTTYTLSYIPQISIIIDTLEPWGIITMKNKNYPKLFKQVATDGSSYPNYLDKQRQMVHLIQKSLEKQRQMVNL